MPIIGTSPTITSTAYPNQRKVDRCQNSVLWAFRFYGANEGVNTQIAAPFYSTDDGATWTAAAIFDPSSIAGGISYTPNGSIFIDLDDYCHMVFKHRGTGYIYYVRGTPNAGRTAWTWSTALLLDQSSYDYPDVVAHREGTGWKVHAIYSFATTGNFTRYCPIDISSGGTITKGTPAYIGGSYGNANHTYPSIDFNHTGDGKTVAGGTPHLYAAWSAGTTGAGNGIRFRKATYSGGTWTWGTEREIDSTRYADGSYRVPTCLFDGTRVLIGGVVYDGDASGDLMLYERDVADTTTTTRILHADMTNAEHLLSGNITYDSDGNVYFIGADNDATDGYDLAYRKWTRATTTLGARIAIPSDVTLTGSNLGNATFKRGYSNNRLEYIFTDGTASPFNIIYGSIILNQIPNTPTNLQVTSVVTDTTPTFSADISDPDSGQQIKGRFQIYQSDGVTLVGTVDSVFRTGAGTVTAEYASALPVGSYKVQAATVDDVGAISAYTAQVAFDVKAVVTTDEQLIWHVDALILDSLQLIWDVAEGNQKDLGLIWNTFISAEKDFSLLWNDYPVWTELDPDPESPVTWEAVLP